MTKKRKKKPVAKKKKKIVRRRVVVAPAASVAEPPFHPLPPVSDQQEVDLARGSDVPTNEGRE